MAFDEFIRDRSLDEIRELASSIRDGEVPEETVTSLRGRIQETPRPALEDPLLAMDDPFRAVATFNELLDALELERIPPPEPTAMPASDLDAEVRTDDQVDAETEIRRIATGNMEPDAVRATVRALREDDPSEAPRSVENRIALLDAEQRERLADELREFLNERREETGAMIQEAEPGRRTTFDDDEYPILFEATATGPGRGESYFRQLKQVLQGDRDPEQFASGKSTIPTEQFAREVRDARDFDPVREQFIERIDGVLESKQRDQSRSAGGAGGGAGGMFDFDTPKERETPDEPFVDESYISEETINRVPALETAFMELVRSLGRSRDFDFTDATMPRQYFRLTPEEQRTYYDATPEEWLARWVQSGTVTRASLRRRGFPPDFIPDDPEE
jgi:hypothetical protein